MPAEGVERGDEWGWMENSFEDTRELSGLKILMILLNNFDARKAKMKAKLDSDLDFADVKAIIDEYK